MRSVVEHEKRWLARVAAMRDDEVMTIVHRIGDSLMSSVTRRFILALLRGMWATILAGEDLS